MRLATDMILGLADLPDFNVVSFAGATAKQEEIVSALEQLPIMSKYRVVEVTEYNKDISKILAYLSRPNPEAVLVFRDSEIRTPFASNMRYFIDVDCSRLDESVLLKWIANKSAELGVAVEVEAAKILIRYANNDLSKINSELNKLSSAAGATITPALVQDLVMPGYEFKIYELSSAVADRRAEETFNIYKQLKNEIAPSGMLGSLYTHFRRLLYIAVTPDKGSLPTYLGVKEYAVTKMARQAARFTPKRLKNICDMLHRADADFKSGLITDEMALDVFIGTVLIG